MTERWTDKKRGFTDGIPGDVQNMSFKRNQREELGGLGQTQISRQEPDGSIATIKGFGKYEKVIYTPALAQVNGADKLLLMQSKVGFPVTFPTIIQEIVCGSNSYRVVRTYQIDDGYQYYSWDIRWSETYRVPVVIRSGLNYGPPFTVSRVGRDNSLQGTKELPSSTDPPAYYATLFRGKTSPASGKQEEFYLLEDKPYIDLAHPQVEVFEKIDKDFTDRGFVSEGNAVLRLDDGTFFTPTPGMFAPIEGIPSIGMGAALTQGYGDIIQVGKNKIAWSVIADQATSVDTDHIPDGWHSGMSPFGPANLPAYIYDSVETDFDYSEIRIANINNPDNFTVLYRPPITSNSGVFLSDDYGFLDTGSFGEPAIWIRQRTNATFAGNGFCSNICYLPNKKLFCVFINVITRPADGAFLSPSEVVILDRQGNKLYNIALPYGGGLYQDPFRGLIFAPVRISTVQQRQQLLK
jgi:hypothetical protein